ncbi:MAG: FecR family protein [Planctomycetota bacterium]
MNPRERFEELWTAFLEGELDPELMVELQSLLEDQELLGEAADSYRMHRLLGVAGGKSDAADSFVGDVMSSLPRESGDFVDGVMQSVKADEPVPVIRRNILLSRLPILLATAAAILVGCFIVFQPVSDEITIVELGGEVTLTGDSGQMVEDLSAGYRFDGGTLESSSADAWVRLRFADASTVTLSGRSLATISQEGQKLLNLRHGNLSADVSPQSQDAPMLINTPSAELEVVGTQFNVGADAARTRLVVNEGMVTLTRHSDGRSADVPANHQLAATTVTADELNVAERPSALATWRANPGSDVVYGEWISSYEGFVGELKQAVANGEMTKEEAFAKLDEFSRDESSGSLFALPWFKAGGRKKEESDKKYGVQLAIVSIAGATTAPVSGSDDAVLRVLGRAYSDCEVVVGLSANNLNGGFAGKFETHRELEADPAGDRRFVLEIPLADFRDGSQTPIGLELVEWWILTTDIETKLEIFEIELVNPVQP